MSLEQIEAGIKNALSESNTALDVVFVILRPVRQTPRKIEILLGRQDGAAVNTKSLPQGNLGIVKWRGIADLQLNAQHTFEHYFKLSNARCVISEPFLAHPHKNYAQEKKLLIYFRVDLAPGEVVACRETPNGFCEPLWCDAKDTRAFADYFATMRDMAKSAQHLIAVDRARQFTPLALAS